MKGFIVRHFLRVWNWEFISICFLSYRNGAFISVCFLNCQNAVVCFLNCRNAAFISVCFLNYQNGAFISVCFLNYRNGAFISVRFFFQLQELNIFSLSFLSYRNETFISVYFLNYQNGAFSKLLGLLCYRFTINVSNLTFGLIITKGSCCYSARHCCYRYDTVSFVFHQVVKVFEVIADHSCNSSLDRASHLTNPRGCKIELQRVWRFSVLHTNVHQLLHILFHM